MQIMCLYWTIGESDRRSSKTDWKSCSNTGLAINENKTKHVRLTRNVTDLDQDLKMEEKVFDVVQNSSCLCALLVQKT